MTVGADQEDCHVLFQRQISNSGIPSQQVPAPASLRRKLLSHYQTSQLNLEVTNTGTQ